MKYLYDLITKDMMKSPNTVYHTDSAGDEGTILSKEICAIANSGGGLAYVGVNSNLELCGFTKKDVESKAIVFRGVLNFGTKPLPEAIFNYIPYEDDNDDTFYIFEIKIAPSSELIYRYSDAFKWSAWKMKDGEVVEIDSQAGNIF